MKRKHYYNKIGIHEIILRSLLVPSVHVYAPKQHKLTCSRIFPFVKLTSVCLPVPGRDWGGPRCGGANTALLNEAGCGPSAVHGGALGVAGVLAAQCSRGQ